MKTSFELEALARQADCMGEESRADSLLAAANEAREMEEDMSMCIPAHERSRTYTAWCEHQRSIFHV